MSDNRHDLLNYIHSNYALEDVVYYLEEQLSDNDKFMKLLKWLDKNADLTIFRDFYQIEMGEHEYELNIHLED